MKFAKSFGAAFALVLLGFGGAYAVNSTYWTGGQPSASNPINGPWLGDYFYNINTIFVAQARDTGAAYNPAVSVSQTIGQANCTQVSGNDAFVEVKTSAGTGYLCLPPAQGGKRISIGNATGQTIDLYSSATPFVLGTQDTINGAAGTSPYTGLSGTNHLAVCVAANNGAWYCMSGT